MSAQADKEPELTDEQILELEQRIKDEEAHKVVIAAGTAGDTD